MVRTYKIIAIAGVMAMGITTSAAALDGYSAQDQKTFMDWCTLSETNSESICSCALKRVAQTVPATALSSYVASLSTGQSLSFSTLATTTASTTAVTVTQALTTCGQ